MTTWFVIAKNILNRHCEGYGHCIYVKYKPEAIQLTLCTMHNVHDAQVPEGLCVTNLHFRLRALDATHTKPIQNCCDNATHIRYTVL